MSRNTPDMRNTQPYKYATCYHYPKWDEKIKRQLKAQLETALGKSRHKIVFYNTGAEAGSVGIYVRYALEHKRYGRADEEHINMVNETNAHQEADLRAALGAVFEMNPIGFVGNATIPGEGTEWNSVIGLYFRFRPGGRKKTTTSESPRLAARIRQDVVNAIMTEAKAENKDIATIVMAPFIDKTCARYERYEDLAKIYYDAPFIETVRSEIEERREALRVRNQTHEGSISVYGRQEDGDQWLAVSTIRDLRERYIRNFAFIKIEVETSYPFMPADQREEKTETFYTTGSFAEWLAANPDVKLGGTGDCELCCELLRMMVEGLYMPRKPKD